MRNSRNKDIFYWYDLDTLIAVPNKHGLFHLHLKIIKRFEQQLYIHRNRELIDDRDQV